MGRALAILAGATIAVLLAAALLLGSGPSGNISCLPTVTADPGDEAIAGYRGDQLVNAAAIITAGTRLRVPADGITIGVMTAMGESRLRNLTYGDTAGPDSRGLFQQRDSWGTLADRLRPATAATAFYRRLLAVPGWQTMTPTRAAHAVQGNANADYYTPFWAPAKQVVAALTGTDGDCATAAVPTGDAQALARQLTEGITAGSITGLAPDHLREIEWIAAGRAVPSCGIDVRILQIITIAWRTFRKVGISDINRRCTGQILGGGTESSHWIHGGGQAVDFYSLGGTSTNGADSNALRLLKALDPVMPHGSRAGQADCRATIPIRLTHVTVFDDKCNHLHIDVAYATNPLAAPTVAAGS